MVWRRPTLAPLVSCGLGQSVDVSPPSRLPIPSRLPCYPSPPPPLGLETPTACPGWPNPPASAPVPLPSPQPRSTAPVARHTLPPSPHQSPPRPPAQSQLPAPLSSSLPASSPLFLPYSTPPARDATCAPAHPAALSRPAYLPPYLSPVSCPALRTCLSSVFPAPPLKFEPSVFDVARARAAAGRAPTTRVGGIYWRRVRPPPPPLPRLSPQDAPTKTDFYCRERDRRRFTQREFEFRRDAYNSAREKYLRHRAGKETDASARLPPPCSMSPPPCSPPPPPSPHVPPPPQPCPPPAVPLPATPQPAVPPTGPPPDVPPSAALPPAVPPTDMPPPAGPPPAVPSTPRDPMPVPSAVRDMHEAMTAVAVVELRFDIAGNTTANVPRCILFEQSATSGMGAPARVPR